jgi:hypothetical protein
MTINLPLPKKIGNNRHQMFSSLKELYSLLTAEQRNKLLRLQLLVILMSFAEIAGVVSIGPFMALVGDIDQLQGEGLMAELFRATGIADPRDFLFWLALGVLAVLSVEGVIRTLDKPAQSNPAWTGKTPDPGPPGGSSTSATSARWNCSPTSTASKRPWAKKPK